MANFFPIDHTKNFSLLTVRPSQNDHQTHHQLTNFKVPAAFGLCYLPHLYAVGAAGFTNYDNSSPRTYRDNVVKDTSMDKVVRIT